MGYRRATEIIEIEKSPPIAGGLSSVSKGRQAPTNSRSKRLEDTHFPPVPMKAKSCLSFRWPQMPVVLQWFPLVHFGSALRTRLQSVKNHTV